MNRFNRFNALRWMYNIIVPPRYRDKLNISEELRALEKAVNKIIEVTNANGEALEAITLDLEDIQFGAGGYYTPKITQEGGRVTISFTASNDSLPPIASTSFYTGDPQTVEEMLQGFDGDPMCVKNYIDEKMVEGGDSGECAEYANQARQSSEEARLSADIAKASAQLAENYESSSEQNAEVAQRAKNEALALKDEVERKLENGDFNGAPGSYVTSINEMGGDETRTTYRMHFSDDSYHEFDVFHGSPGADGERGPGILKVTTTPAAYTTSTGGKSPIKRMALSTIKSEAGVSEVLVGDCVCHSYYLYHIYYLDSSYAYMDKSQSIRGASGAAGANGNTPVKGVDYLTDDDTETWIFTLEDGTTVTKKVVVL